MSASGPHTVGEKILRIRKAKRLNQEELAKLLGIYKGTISKWESATKLSTDQIRMLAAALEVRQAVFLDELPDDLAGKTFEQIAARESLRLYLQKRDVPPNRISSHRFWRGVDLPGAPRTVEEWKSLEAFLGAISGGKA
jgi:transcriptional regulator with XRE-family HTH domain